MGSIVQLDSDLLRTFVAVADSGNFTRAADSVGRTQSAVSMQIKRLEEIVGEQLFERGSRGVELTRKGELLLGNSRRIVSLMEETEASFRAPPLSGRVRIGIPEEYGYTVLSQALGSFARAHPRVDITAHYGPSARNLAALDANQLDLAVVFEWEDVSSGETLRIDPTVWVTSDDHNQHLESPLPIALYDRSGWCTDFAMKSIEQRRLEYRIAYRSDTSGGLKLAVASGLAIAPISRSNIPEGCRELGAMEGFGDIDTSRVVLHRNPKSKSAVTDGMVEAIRAAFRDVEPVF
ncbi:LysR family transcriptional regulator [Nitratireductor mangrovi]|uniref:LysR family transcriptional regulator n=1 Tax=Nitratireductor mangrovi TaxID=2599600 RepID=A0A5B8L2L3_9HYPH|nr:LysR family transcriptional regulator [Nitratireductor mangrovi]QDZ02053.1 LysR family transcriptional regulator [Nitratireductor mangrovi]